MKPERTARQLSTAQRDELVAVIADERRRAGQRLAASKRTFDEIVESSTTSLPDDEHDPEGSTIAFERAQVAALTTQAETYLVELEAAMDRLNAGSYGICESCGEVIPFERLLARPTARTCVGCST